MRGGRPPRRLVLDSHKGSEGAGKDETAEKGSVDAEHAQVGYAGGGTP